MIPFVTLEDESTAFYSSNHTADETGGPNTITRIPTEGAIVLFHMAYDGTIKGASGIGLGNSIGRDIKVAEMLIAKNAKPSPEVLADPTQPLKALLKG